MQEQGDVHFPLDATRTPLWRVDPKQPEEEILRRAAAVVCRGGVVIYPTETFYGLGGDPRIEAAVRRVYAIKERAFRKPLPLIAADLASVKSLAAQWPLCAERLASAFWPGPLTLVLQANDQLPEAVHAHTGRIAVRVSSHPAARALSVLAGGLLISTSANPSEAPPCANPDRIPLPFLDKVDGLLHAGDLPGGLPSTIVDVSAGTPLLVRAGQIPWEEIKDSLGIPVE